MSAKKPNPDDKKPATPKAPEPVAAAAPAPAPAAAAPAAVAKPAAPKYVPPEPVLNRKNGRLIEDRFTTWPTQVFANRWSRPGYQWGAGMLVAIFAGLAVTGTLVGELPKLADWVMLYLNGKPFKLLIFTGPIVHIPLSALGAQIAWTMIKVLIVLHVVLINGLWSIWWERKISAHIQSRVGPTYAGSPKGFNFHGWAQTAIDGIKLLLKEDITPAAADKWVHALAPGLVVAPCIIAFAPVLFGNDLAAANIDVGVLYIFAMAGISVIGVVMAGWASGNK
ncbi:MAG: NADH-quinone oxidoreductase subunit H, partial [Elusimicrobiota bacterium]|nr:NADH-quinone oxidoreductase subunit H [Elusimicrobiota bacterium]